MTTGEVADDAARFTNQQLACGEVPRAQTDFKETVNTTRSDVSQIDLSFLVLVNWRYRHREAGSNILIFQLAPTFD